MGFDIDQKTIQKELEGMYIAGDCIVLNYACYYDIEFSRRYTPGKILGWINQLSSKTWMDAARLNRFARLAFQQIGVEIDLNI